jgi:hypothetical protein
VAVKLEPPAPAKRFSTGDVWVDAMLLQAEERMAKARARPARRAVLRSSRPPRPGVRVWVGSLLLAVGQRLCGPGVAHGPAGTSGRSARERLADP